MPEVESQLSVRLSSFLTRKRALIPKKSTEHCMWHDVKKKAVKRANR